MQQYLTGVFAFSVGAGVCLTGIGIPIGVVLIGVGYWLIVTHDKKN
ncbi:MAG: hypothetical protein ACO1RA_08845 [Planctomycetaceae bacterium]